MAVIPQPIEEETESNLLDLSFDGDSSDTHSVWDYPEQSSRVSEEQNVIAEKDRIIQKLMERIQELELEISQTRAENEKRIEEYKAAIVELECATAQRMEREIEVLKQSEQLKLSSEAQSQVAKVTERYTKMKEFYNKLRSEHIELIRAKAEIERQLSVSKMEFESVSQQKLQLQLKENMRKESELSSMNTQKQMESLQSDFDRLSLQTDQLKREELRLKHELAQNKSQFDQGREQLDKLQASAKFNYKQYIMNYIKHSLSLSTSLIRNDGQQIEIGFTTINCSSDYYLNQVQLLLNHFGVLEASLVQASYNLDLYSPALNFYHQLYFISICSKTFIQNVSNLDLANELQLACTKLLATNQELAHAIDNNFAHVQPAVVKVRTSLEQIEKLVHAINAEFMSRPNVDFEALLNDEMEQMDRVIQEAATKIERMIALAHQKDTGVKLEVSGKILDSCTLLMQAIKQLIYNAKQLQKEIATKSKV